MASNEMQKSHLYSTYFAPRGRERIYNLGIQIAQLYLSPFDLIIGIIGEAGSGKSMLIKGMFPGLELTNDDNGVNVRPLPLLDDHSGFSFFSPHTYHLDIRFEMAFHNMNKLADAILDAVHKGKRVVVEHFDLIYPLLQVNANLLIGIGEEIVITRPTVFGPEPKDVYDIAYASLPYRLMAHTAEDLCEMCLGKEIMASCSHGDVRHGFVLSFPEKPDIDLMALEKQVQALIDQDLGISYMDESHVTIGETVHPCTGPRTHVRTTGQVHGFHLMNRFVYDSFSKAYLLVGCVGEDSIDNLMKLKQIHPTEIDD